MLTIIAATDAHSDNRSGNGKGDNKGNDGNIIGYNYNNKGRITTVAAIIAILIAITQDMRNSSDTRNRRLVEIIIMITAMIMIITTISIKTA